MKDKKLSLDELISLGEEFHRLNKWRVQDSGKYEVEFVTEKINNLYMSLHISYEHYHNDIYVGGYCLTLNASYPKTTEMELGKYSTRQGDTDFENSQKLSELHNLIKEKAYVFYKKEIKKRQEKELMKERKEKERKNQAVETAMKLIKK